ncbi:GNAT family N-acetyltransferase [Telmatospirillum siberiense]|uniref:GNAT family N-acetyltransferase n=1 Tax=Telmatospirillum siberiense TaxID=382514 RepID=A0A2N3PUW2_9PROT|nr:GNAT family N-acetyltransferase [Telmatospirillum siberiense]PKU24186.1 GNAT family N-acetyltransferase [Telmatospirillum siberiense]
MTSVTIRPAEPEDAQSILALLGQLARFEGAPEGICLTERAIREEAFGDHPRFQVLLADTDGVPCGLLIFYQAYSSWSAAPTLMVHDLFVLEAHRRSGAGRALLAEAARIAESRGCCRMDVNVLAWNEPARRFYAAAGFRHLETWLPYRLDAGDMGRLAALRV